MQKLLACLLLFAIIVRVSGISNSLPEGKRVRIIAKVTSEPVVYDNARQLALGNIVSYVELYPEINYGDRVTIEGTVKEGRLVKPEIIDVKEAGGLYFIRQKILEIYQSALPEPHSSLVSGIVLGSKSSMPGDFWEKLKSTGTAHVVVASGMNVTFVISFLVNSLINFTKRRNALIIALAGAWVYVLLSGFDAPLVRAAIMGSIAFSAQGLGRAGSAIRALFVSAAVMLIIKPVWLYDLGFILSFVATFSLIMFERKVSGLLSKIPVILKKDLATTLAAQIGVAPILFVSFGSFNVLSPFINALVLWTIPPIMIIGGVAAIVGLLVPALGGLISLLTFPFTFWFVKIVGVMS